MKYNIFIVTNLRTLSILDLTENEVKKILKAYQNNSEFYFIRGKKIYTGDLIEIQI